MFPPAPAGGKSVIRILGSTPDEQIPQYYITLLTAIRTAEKSVKITAAYFAPTKQEMESLIDAARRGVDVRLLLPGRSDFGPVHRRGAFPLCRADGSGRENL